MAVEIEVMRNKMMNLKKLMESLEEEKKKYAISKNFKEAKRAKEELTIKEQEFASLEI